VATLDKVLFIGHDATRTGAPLLLLELMKWLIANSTVKPSLLLKRGGEIESHYRAIVPTSCYTDERNKLNRGIHWSVLRKLRLSNTRQPNLAKLFPPEQYPVVYANTIDTCDMAMQLVGVGRRLVHHIHELSYITELFGATEILKKAVSKTDFYIADSYAVHPPPKFMLFMDSLSPWAKMIAKMQPGRRYAVTWAFQTTHSSSACVECRGGVKARMSSSSLRCL